MEFNRQADRIFTNANIYTLNEQSPIARALAVKGDRLQYIGSEEAALALAGPDTEIENVSGRTILPGVIEGHTHFTVLSKSQLEIDATAKAKDDILMAIKRAAENASPGDWILGSGWNNEIWENPEFPTKVEIDAVAPDHPVCLARKCYHAYWVNSTALKRVGITIDSQDPEGGEIKKDDAGNPTGVLVGTATEALTSRIPPPDNRQLEAAYMKAQAYLFSLGITTIMDAGVDAAVINLIQKLYRDDRLDLRINAYAMEGETAADCYRKGVARGLYQNRWSIGGVKFFADGSLGAGSAHMLSDYSDRPGHAGNMRYTDEALYCAFREARQQGFQIAVHAGGDGSLHKVVNALARVLDEVPLADHRYRIEHFQVATRADIAKAAEYNLIPSMQTVHAATDWEMINRRLGAGSDRIKRAYPWRDIVDAGLRIVNGSDAPVESSNPFLGLHAAVTRTDEAGRVWYPEQCLNRDEALKTYTIWSAYAHFEEHLKGSLETGKLADFIVINRDYMTCNPSEIKEIKVDMTVVGGKTVFNRQV